MSENVAAKAWEERASGSTTSGNDARSAFERDYARIVHSSSFRRLQGKTQILALGDDDFYRTRLTHSIEVAQIADGIVQQLRRGAPTELAALLPPSCLAQAIGLAHDLGHPPFGHGGEYALNFCMRDHGGFEGNAQTLRLLTRLEAFTAAHGADLSRRALLGILKYPVLRSSVLGTRRPALKEGCATITVLDRESCKPPKACFDEDREAVDWILAPMSQADRARFQAMAAADGAAHGKPLHKSFDCSIMDFADDIAYGVHDLEDAVTLGLIARDAFQEAIGAPVCQPLVDAFADGSISGFAPRYEAIVDALFGTPSERKRIIGRLVTVFIRNAEVQELQDFKHPLLRFRVGASGSVVALLSALKKLVVDVVIESPRVQHLEFKGQRMVVAVFEALASDPKRLLPADVYQRYLEQGSTLRIVCDHVSSMTDAALLRTYERLFSPRMGSVFDRF